MRTDTDDEKLVLACPDPECNSAQVYHRQLHSPNSRVEDDHHYRCKECGNTFDDPNERPPLANGGHAGVGKLLEDADPEDWP